MCREHTALAMVVAAPVLYIPVGAHQNRLLEMVLSAQDVTKGLWFRGITLC